MKPSKVFRLKKTIVNLPSTLYGLIMANGPVNYWRNAESSGTVMVDEVAADGYYVGGAPLGQAALYPSGPTSVGPFNGTINGNSTAFPSTMTAMTLVTIVRPTNLSGYHLLGVQRDNNGSGGQRVFQWRSNGSAMEFIKIIGGVDSLVAPDMLAVDTTYMLAFEVGADGVYAMYRNGIAVKTGVTTALTEYGGPGDQYQIGSAAGPGAALVGYTSENAVFNKVLGPSTHAALYAASGLPAVSRYWSPDDKNFQVTLINDNKTSYKTTGNGHALVRGGIGRSTGKFYVEFATPLERGNVPGGGITSGLAGLDVPNNTSPGESGNSFGVQYRRYLGSGDGIWTYHNGNTGGYSGIDPATGSGWLGIAVDMDNQRLWWIADGAWSAGKNPRDSPTSGWTSTGWTNRAMYPAQSCYYGHDVYPTVEGTVRTDVSEMSIGVAAFQSGGVLEGFLPWNGGTIPAPISYDPDYDKRKLLLHFDGGDGSTTYTDSSAVPKTVNSFGGMQQRDFAKKWGASSAYFIALNNTYLAVNDSDDFTVGSGDFGIDTWAYFLDDPLSYAGDYGMYLIGQGTATVSSRSFGLFILGSNLSNCTVVFEVISGSTRYQATANNVNIAKSVWKFLRATRDGNTLRLALDGVQIATCDVTGVTVNDSSRPLLIGGFEDATYGYYLNACLDDLRLTKGISLPINEIPTGPFKNQGPTL